MAYDPTLLLQKWSSESPNNKAVFYKRWYSFKEFNDLVGKFAHFLTMQGVVRDQGVSLYFDHSIESLALIFAVHQLGAFFVPFSKNQSPILINELIEDNKLGPIFCLFQDSSQFKDCCIVEIEEIEKLKPLSNVTQGEFAYIIFTSGTTGKPKGVHVTRKNLEYIFQFIEDLFPCHREDTLIWNTPYTFDVSLVEIFGWVKSGGKVTIQNPDEVRLFNRLSSFLLEHNVTHLNLSPTVLAGLLDLWSNEDFSKINKILKYLLIAGEEFPIEIAKHTKMSLQDVKLFNLYGPTETSVYATGYEVLGNEKDILPIGKSLRDATVKIMCEKFTELENGKKGELCIFGKGVSAGYYRNINQTKEKFGEIDGSRFYKTGDFARIMPDGNIDYLGRKDRQVQLNGIRVELSSIETRVDRFFDHPGSVRIIYKNNKLHLFYLNISKDINALKQFCIDELNSYEKPNTFTPIKEFPLTTNRKLNEAKLLFMLENENRVLNTSSLNNNEIIKNVLSAFNISHTSLNLSFSDSGLDSLGSVMGLSKLEKKFNISLPEYLILGQSTPQMLIEEISKKMGQTSERRDEVLIELKSNLDKQVESWKSITSILFKNGKNKKHKTLGLQKVYFHDKFESAMAFKINLSKKYKTDEIVRALEKLFQNVQSFRLSLENSDNLYFNELIKFDVCHIPYLKIPSDSRNYKDQIEQIDDLLTGHDKKIVTESSLFTPAVIEFNDQYIVFLSLSHMISDGSCEFVLKKLITEILEKGDCVSTPYTDFIKFVSQNTDSKKIINLKHSKDLLEIGKVENITFDFYSEINKKTFEINSRWSMDKKISYLCFQLGEQYSTNLEIDRIPISMILNLRDFNGFDASSVVGDIHTTLVTWYEKGDSLESFSERIKNIKKEYTKGNNPYYAAFENFPNMSKIEQQLESIYDANPLLSLNFLGFLDSTDEAGTLLNLEKTRQVLSAFPANRLYLTAYEDMNSKINLYSLNKIVSK